MEEAITCPAMIVMESDTAKVSDGPAAIPFATETEAPAVSESDMDRDRPVLADMESDTDRASDTRPPGPVKIVALSDTLNESANGDAMPIVNESLVCTESEGWLVEPTASAIYAVSEIATVSDSEEAMLAEEVAASDADNESTNALDPVMYGETVSVTPTGSDIATVVLLDAIFLATADTESDSVTESDITLTAVTDLDTESAVPKVPDNEELVV
jgi:hypothetical protein